MTVDQRVTRLEVQFSHMADSLTAIQSDVRVLRDALVGAKWAGRVILLVVAGAGTAAGWFLRGAPT